MLTSIELDELKAAKALLEHPNFGAKAANLLGAPFEHGAALLPKEVREAIGVATHTAIERALDWAVGSLELGNKTASPRLHRALAAAAGAAGGAFGLLGLVVELPLSTTLILRSIAETAREAGEDVRSEETRLACVQVFALGGFSPNDDAAETGYFAARTGIAQAVTEASRHIAAKGLGKKGAPVLTRLVGAIAQRFGVVVSDKVLLTAVPVVGAVSGAAVNAFFMDHFQKVARGHFVVRRLERKYGHEMVKEAYARM